MITDKIWHEDDDFWNRMEEWIFMESRWKAASKEIEQLLEILQLPEHAAILDLGCGPGRHSIDLARRGFRVTGVDRTEKYLEKARDNAAREALEIEYIQDDMRRFCRENSFSAVINLFTAIGYFTPEEERQIFENIFKSLKKGGKLALDLMGVEVIARIFQARDWIEKDGKFFLEERLPDPDWSYMNSRWIVFDGPARYEKTIRLRLYTAYELSLMLKEVGFSKTECFGHYDGSPYDEDAKRLLIIAEK